MKKFNFSIWVLLLLLIGCIQPANAQGYQLPDVNKLASAMWAPVFKDLANDYLYSRNYSKLYKLCYDEIYGEKKQYPVAIAYYYMGACLELGMGGCEVSQYKAKAHYEKGASLGNDACKNRLQQIKTNGYWTASNDNRTAFAKMHGRPIAPGGGDGGGTISPGKDNGTTCKGCSGSGKCSYCGGKGEYWIDAGAYVAGDRYVKRKCTVCHGSKRCGVCYGKGSIK